MPHRKGKVEAFKYRFIEIKLATDHYVQVVLNTEKRTVLSDTPRLGTRPIMGMGFCTKREVGLQNVPVVFGGRGGI